MALISPRDEHPENPTPGLLSAQISSLDPLDHLTAIPKLASLVPGLTASISPTGERLVHHEAYHGTGNLNHLARIWLLQGSRCKQDGAPLHLRLQQYTLRPYFRALYEKTHSDLGKAQVARFFAGFREFSIACAHCVGAPWEAFTEGTVHMRLAMYFEEKEYESIWGEVTPAGSLAGMSGVGEERRMVRWEMARVEQVEEAIGRGID